MGKTANSTGPDFLSVHGRDSTEVHASDLTLDKFIDAKTLAPAPTLPGPSAEVRTVLLTGATGFLGRYLALEWLERAVRNGDERIEWFRREPLFANLRSHARFQQILESVQGPVAKIVAVIIIITTGLSLAFGETSGGFRRLIQIVFGLSIAFAASSFFLSFFSFAGGAMLS